MPDHTVRRVPLGPGHTATLRNLPQGNYRVDVKAGGAVVSAQTVRLSRSENGVNLAAVSPGDLAVVGGAALVIGLAGLPLLSGLPAQATTRPAAPAAPAVLAAPRGGLDG